MATRLQVRGPAAGTTPLRELSRRARAGDGGRPASDADLLGKSDNLTADDISLGRPGSSPGGLPDAALGFFTLPAAGTDCLKLEEQLRRQALARTVDHQTKAAKLLNLSGDTFRYRMEKHGLL